MLFDRFISKQLVGLFLIFLPVIAAAQSKTVTGTVKDETGTPLPGVTVTIKNGKTGTSTDAAGKFSITAGNGATLVLTFIGYDTREVPLDGRTSFDVSLKPVAKNINEVVVTALGIARQSKSLVYATQSIKTAELNEVRDANNILNSLQGKVANAIITQGSGGPGSGARIVLRGNRSIQGSNNALIVVDGVPIANPTYNVTGNTFGGIQGPDGASNMNPDDIENMTVLRGASAAALYGSQAGNGVLVITTKKGNKNGFAVNLNSGVTFESAFSLPQVQNQYGQGLGNTINPAVGDSWGPKMTGQSFTDHLGEQATYSAQPNNIRGFFRNGVALNNYVGISAGNEKMQSYFSYTNNSIGGIVPENNLMRHIVNLRITNQITPRLSTDAKITYINQRINNLPRNGEENAPVIDLYQIPRNVSLATAKNYQKIGDQGTPVATPWPATLGSIYQNPYWMIYNTSINAYRDRIMGFLSMKYSLTDWLSVTGRANLDKMNDQLDQSYMEGTVLRAGLGTGGDYFLSNINTTQQWYDVIFEGKNRIAKDLEVNYYAGGIFRDISNKNNSIQATGLRVPNRFSTAFAKAPSPTASAGGTQTQSLFAQATLGYKNAVFLDASIRNDWDSRLPSPYSYAYYSAGASVIISDLVHLPKAISFLKGSLNYAQVGNGGQEQIRNAVFNFTQSAGNGQISRNTILPIENLKPEIVGNIEASLDIRFLDQRIGLATTYYKSNSKNQLLSLSVPAATGYLTQYINAGNIQNTGWEFLLTGTPVRSSGFNWDVAYNLSFNNNKVIALTDNIKTFSINSDARVATVVVQTGSSYGDLFGLKWATNDAGQRIVTSAGKPVLTTTTGYIGNFNPRASMGLTNTFTYKGFSLRLLVDGRVGGTIVSGTEMNLAFSGIPKVTEQYREGGWNLGGVDNNKQAVTNTISAVDFWQTASGKRYGAAEFFAYDATSFRLRELSFGYDIPVANSGFFKALKLSAVARNLAWIYRGSSLLDIPGLGKRKMWFDPELSLANSNYQGVEYGNLPSTRSWGFNLKASF
ncbi:SusC/RagA family TonB-linked outer membrane protein [Chitinophaga sp. Ak27]|uniref:SusC/RagA family TonB-linked outer membrane protein n=1 Tax=Chitinophaga sp. Ak27 TaxID=2726116 RepID=UPI00145FC02C|nr:SusC/RagA family TonB-linked outer membrane protein [Chitinophaga sp. Ak27]NLU90467.1 SusC/RagA family TonB-linked outer membrane protein [Chitinophaga sp. Ak27]